ncbi:hypothetical protein BST61_g1433 [Cercospora zeina]
MRFHRASDLAAFTCTDGCIRVIDIKTQKLVRELWRSRTPLAELKGLKFSDFAFSTDGRWLTASAGQLVFLWDLPTGHLVDVFKLKDECTTLAFSPTGEYLATATKDNVGVDIWTNRSLFTHVSTRHITHKELLAVIHSTTTSAPTASGEGSTNLIAASAHESDAEDDAEAIDLETDPASELDTLSADLISLSLVPRSRWQNLLHLDLIRQRNKPTEAPKKPEKSPFFLPSLQDLPQTKPGTSSNTTPTTEEIEKERSRVVKLSQSGSKSQFTTLLHTSSSSQDFSPFLSHLSSLPPATADIEIRSLSHTDNEHVAFVQALTWKLRSKRDFELVQAWMTVWLRVHGDLVVQDEGVRAAVTEYWEGLEEERRRVERLVGFVGGMVGWVRAARV